MWGIGLRLAGRLAIGLLGAILLAACVSALPVKGAGVLGFAHAMASRLLAIAHLDFGLSAVSAQPASAELARSLPATLELVGFGGVIALVLGMPLGFLLSAGKVLRAGAPLIQIVAAAPVFCAGLALLWLSDRVLHWTGAPRAVSLVTALGHGNVGEIESAFRAIALPALTVGIAGAASVQLALRRAIGHALGEPYRRGLRAMGLGRFEVDRLYLMPQVLAGLLQSLGEIALSLFAAAAVAEWVFGWPGAAVLFLRSVALQDWSVAALVLLVFAALTQSAEFVGRLGAQVLAHTEVGA
jgi:ABC-type dipeptide/oligopeptide/nickel transport system permease component